MTFTGIEPKTLIPKTAFSHDIQNSINLYHGQFVKVDLQAPLGVERDKKIKVMNITWGKFSPTSQPQLWMQIQDCGDGEIRWVRIADVLDVRRI